MKKLHGTKLTNLATYIPDAAKTHEDYITRLISDMFKSREKEVFSTGTVIKIPMVSTIMTNDVRKQRNKQRAALAGTNKTYHDVKFMRWPHIEIHDLFIHETDWN